MDPIIGGALIGGVGNLLGFGSQAATNKNNMKIAQMNNQFNAAEAEKNRKFQTDTINAQNEYNTAANQRKRLEAAGYNPYLAQSGQAGVAQGASASGSQAQSAGNPQMQAYKPDFSSIGSTIQSMSQSELLGSQKRNQDIKNLHQTDVMRAQIDNLIGSTDFTKLDKGTQSLYRSMGAQYANLQQSTLEQNLENMKLAGALTQAKTANVLLDSQAQSVINRYIDQDQQMSLNLKASMYENMVMEGQMKPVQAQKLIADTILTYARTKGQKIDNAIASQTARSLIDANNAANRYSSTYNTQAIKGAKTEYNMDYNAKKFDTEYRKYTAGTASRDYSSYTLRNSIDYAGRIIHGVGNAVGTYNDIRRTNNDTYRSRRSYDYDEEGYKDKDGNYGRSRRYK